MDLTTKVNKAVESHLERVNAVDRSLRFLPSVNGKADLSPKTLSKIRSGVYKPKELNGVLLEHWERLRLNYKWNQHTPIGEFLPSLCLSVGIEEETLTKEPTTFVSDDIIDLLTYASERIEAEPLRETDVFAPAGFVYLEKPLIVNIPRQHFESGELDQVVGIRAMSWRTSENILPAAHIGQAELTRGITTNLYTDAGCVRYITGNHDFFPDTVPDNVITLVDVSGWAFDQLWRAPEEGEKHGIKDGIIVASPDTVIARNFLLSLFRFMWQELLLREPADLPRAIRRGAVRKLGIEEPITILKLRRARSSSSSTGEGSRLDHRILVRGHWRNQYYPSLGPVDSPDSHRMIWIDPHVKGPEDAPFLTKPKATAVVR